MLVRCENDAWGITVNEGLSSAGGVRRQRMAGLEARQSADTSKLWHDMAEYPDGRVGVVIGSCADHHEAARLRAGTSSRLRAGADPAAVLRALDAPAASVLAAVIDRNDSLMSYGSIGSASPALAAPELPGRGLRPTRGTAESVALQPGAIVLLSTRGMTLAVPLPASNDQIFQDLLAGSSAGEGVVMVLYRHPPAPLNITVPAEPASLAVVRRQLRMWLAMTETDDEMRADILLAIGEAATNAAEHADNGAGRTVQITVQAHLIGESLRFTVSDNGSWKTPAASDGHRGHGIRLMKALVDGVDVTTTSEGTTVQMCKELAG